MEEYIKKEELIRKIICNMAEFIGEPDDVQKHDEQCNYAIRMIEEASVADVAPVVHAKWIEKTDPAGKYFECSHCGAHENKHTAIKGYYCWRCGAKMDGGDNDAESID